ncbi:MAG: hypothetical protein ACI977_000675 [Candidatus Nanohaloarchaea archaeon]|jgi:hypothetical protein
MRKLVIALLLIGMISSVSAQSTGAAPSLQSLGDVQPGQTVQATIYVTGTSYEEPYAIKPEAVEPLASKFLDASSSPIPVQSYSEESTVEWVSFDQETYTIDPTNSTPYVLPNGAEVNANGELTLTVRIPNDAEPGWHSGAVQLNPQTGGGTGFGASARTVSQPTFVFNVQTAEEPERLLEVVDARGIRTGENTARIDMRIANRGTVTTTIRNSDIDVLDRINNQKIGELSLGFQSLEPGRSQVVSTSFNSEAISQGSYVLNGSIDYSSSRAFAGQQTFALSSQIQEDPESPDSFNDENNSNAEGSGTPMWLVGLFILVISAVMYSFGFDLFWILVAAGFLGIALFIVLTPVPIWMLIVLLTTPVIILYYA